ncbi:hypothetical protein J4772_33765 [Cohnella sp. LGH]|uniref:hypothetical protein n=1 Tax=Cohnella sp. LGH TaxID=1619153 RepID=UPI001ADB2B43|nr:hypothetical protein [Cohnella sp. LGH]QTH42382.1 hypothetical protein J4772_33765 [Cohnella sp. LGH]
MSEVWLQAAAAALFLTWISILLAMRKPGPGLPAILDPKKAFAAEEDPVEPEAVAAAPPYSFSKWEKLLGEEDGSCKFICENPRWEEAAEAYDVFAKSCEEKGIAFVGRERSDWISGRITAHFDDCRLMPLLWAENYHVHLVQGRSLFDLLREAAPFSIIIISVKDDGSQALNHDWQEKLCEVGVRSLTREHLRHSYINIIWKKYHNTYINLYEECSVGPLAKRYDQGDFINDFKFPMCLEVESAGCHAGNYSRIRIDGRQCSQNLRGMNIAVFDMMDSKAEGIYRVDTFITMYEDNAIYRAVPAEGEKNAS